MLIQIPKDVPIEIMGPGKPPIGEPNIIDIEDILEPDDQPTGRESENDDRDTKNH